MTRSASVIRQRIERLSARRAQDLGRDLLIVYAAGLDIRTYPMRDDATVEGWAAILEDYRLFDGVGPYDRVSLFGYICYESRCIGPNGEPCEGHKAVIQDCTGGPHTPWPHDPENGFIHMRAWFEEDKREKERGNG